MRRRPAPSLPLLLAAALAWGAAGAAPALAGEAAAPSPAAEGGKPLYAPTPFGPGYDTTRPEPTEPPPAGKGLESATLVAAGPAEVEELRDAKDVDASKLFGLVLDVRIAAASTTASLGPSTVTLGEAGAEPQALFVLCLPTAGAPLTMTRTVGVGMGNWNVAIGDQAFHCGGRNMRLASRFIDGGVTVTTPAASAWQGPLLLLFRAAPAAEAELKLAGLAVKVPVSAKARSAGN